MTASGNGPASDPLLRLILDYGAARERLGIFAGNESDPHWGLALEDSESLWRQILTGLNDARRQGDRAGAVPA
jgi:hypothetical protein